MVLFRFESILQQLLFSFFQICGYRYFGRAYIAAQVAVYAPKDIVLNGFFVDDIPLSIPVEHLRKDPHRTDVRTEITG